jgi:flagellar biosynthesis/type III secretory pathway protein FliH
LNRVIRHAQLADAVEYFGGGEPQFVDEHVIALVEQARTDGYAAGWQDGRDKGRLEVESLAARLEAAIRAAAAEMRHAHHDAVHTTVDAAFAVAEFIVGRTPHETSVLAARIAEAVEALDDEELVVLVASSDFGALHDVLDLAPGITLEPDDHLQPGEARVRGKWSAVEMTRRAALAVAEEALS